MNKFSIIVKSTMIAMGMMGVAHAESTWTGFYAGVNTAFIFNHAQLKSQQIGFTSPSDTCNASADYSTFSPGVQFGYLYQLSNSFVTGIEANITINNNQNHTLNCNSNINPNVDDRFTFTNQMQTSIKGRVGRVLNWNKSSLLPYLTVGASLASVGLTYKNEGGDYYANYATQAGWLIGTGIEWAFKQHWSVRAEYNYIDYGNVINLNIPSIYGLQDPNGNGHIHLSSNNVFVALNYWI